MKSQTWWADKGASEELAGQSVQLNPTDKLQVQGEALPQ